MAFSSFTVITMPFTDGSSRTFHYSRVLGPKEANDLLDHLIDEMHGMPFNGPIEVFRQWWTGIQETETIGMLCPDE